MASVILKRSRPSALKSAVVVGIRMGMSSKAYASVAGAFTGVCSQQHVPGYKNNIDKFKAKGIVVCVAVNDRYALNGWAEKIQAKEAIEFYGDFDGSFHKSLDLGKDLSAALLRASL